MLGTPYMHGTHGAVGQLIDLPTGWILEPPDAGVASEGLVIQHIAAVSDGVDCDFGL